MIAKTPSLNASTHEVGISPTLKSLCDGLYHDEKGRHEKRLLGSCIQVDFG